MAQFPTAVYEPRTKQNKPGVEYQPTEATKMFAEDVTKLDDEVVAIENALGENLANVILQSEKDQVNGVPSLDDNGFINPLELHFAELSDDTTPQLGGDLDMNLKNIKYKTTGMNDNSGVGDIVADINAGASLAFGNVCYLNSAGKWALADADAIATTGMLSFALESKSTDQAIKVLLRGFIRDDDYNFTVGAPVYLSTDAGGITQTQPSGTDDVIVILGFAVHADRFYFNPQLTFIEHV